MDTASIIILDLDSGPQDIVDGLVKTTLADIANSTSRIAVSHRWIDACVKRGELCDPEPYKVTFVQSGPKGVTVDDAIYISSDDELDFGNHQDEDDDFDDYMDALASPPPEDPCPSGTECRTSAQDSPPKASQQERFSPPNRNVSDTVDNDTVTQVPNGARSI